MSKPLYKSAEDFLQQQADRAISNIQGTQPNYTRYNGEQIRLEGDQARATLDPVFQRNNPAVSAMSRYREEMPENTLSYRTGAGLRSWIMGLGGYRRTPNGGHGIFGTNNGATSALAAGVPLALAGAGAGWIADKMQGNKDHRWASRGAMAGGAVGLGVGGYVGNERNKLASFWKSDTDGTTDQLVQMINSAPGLSYQQKDIFASGVSNLSASQSKQLMQILMSSGGFGIGAIIAKFLMGAGLGGTLMGGLAGGLVGNAIANKPPTDALGMRTTGGSDLFGNRYF